MNINYPPIPKYTIKEDIITARQGNIYEDIFFKKYLSKSRINFETTDKLDIFDFIGITETENIFIELKSRNCTLTQYADTIIGKNKIEYFNKLNSLNPDKSNILYLVFCYGIKDNPDKDFYYVKYSTDLFKSFNITPIYNRLHYNIPIENLNPLGDALAFDETI
jgi:hypothetical protein